MQTLARNGRWRRVRDALQSIALAGLGLLVHVVLWLRELLVLDGVWTAMVASVTAGLLRAVPYLAILSAYAWWQRVGTMRCMMACSAVLCMWQSRPMTALQLCALGRVVLHEGNVYELSGFTALTAILPLMGPCVGLHTGELVCPLLSMLNLAVLMPCVQCRYLFVGILCRELATPTYGPKRGVKRPAAAVQSSPMIVRKKPATASRHAERTLEALASRLASHGGAFGANASPGAQDARKLWRKLQGQAAGMTPRRGVLLAETAALEDRDLRTCQQYWGCYLAHEGAAPNGGGRRPAHERSLARKCARFEKKVRDRPDAVSGEGQRLLRRIHAEAAPLMGILQREQAAAQTSRDFVRRHQVEGLRHLPRAQKRMGSGQSHCGSSPFPWFVNAGNSCYLDSVISCLFHCAGPRQHIRSMRRSSALREALQDILLDYTDGIVEPAGATPWHWDVLAPCRLIDAVEEVSRQTPGQDVFDFGPQHDAAAVLGFLLHHAGMGAACFAAHAPGVPGAQFPVRRDDVLMPPGAVDPATPLGALLTHDCIIGPALVQELLSTEEGRLRAAPPFLAIRFPQFLFAGDFTFGEERQWIQPEDADSYRPVVWQGGCVDLRACCAAGCAGAENAVYRLRACVHYCNRGHVPGPGVSDEGHFTAFFRSAETWYSMDDLDPEAVVRALSACPTEYPYICFLERVGDPEAPQESISPREVFVNEKSADDDEGVSDSSAQASAPRASAGQQTPAKRTQPAEDRSGGALKMAAHGRSGRGQDRSGRAQDRSGQAQERSGGAQEGQDRSGRAQVRSGRAQDRSGQAQERSGQAQERSGGAQDRRGKTIDHLRRTATEKASDNSDGRRLDLDNETAEAYPVGAFLREEQLFCAAAKERKRLGDVFVCLHLLAAHFPQQDLGALLHGLPEVASFVGADCSPEWLLYLRRSLPEASKLILERLQESLGVTEDELRAARERLEAGT